MYIGPMLSAHMPEPVRLTHERGVLLGGEVVRMQNGLRTPRIGEGAKRSHGIAIIRKSTALRGERAERIALYFRRELAKLIETANGGRARMAPIASIRPVDDEALQSAMRERNHHVNYMRGGYTWCRSAGRYGMISHSRCLNRCLESMRLRMTDSTSEIRYTNFAHPTGSRRLRS